MARPTEDDARRLDASDPFRPPRDEFLVPPWDGRYAEVAYFAGNSLGLQPAALAGRLTEELDDWSRLAVNGHLESRRPWVSYHELLRAPAARLVGARPAEVVAMNSLTVNLHLLMASFYRPTPERPLILVEDTAFPSDSYAVRSQAVWHGLDPDGTVVRVTAPDGRLSEAVVDHLRAHGDRVALVLLGAVNYYSGELLDLPAITRAGHEAGAIVAFDLAHAAGNVPMELHDWDVDWAAWCTYKYLNSAPGAVAGVFVHERHLGDPSRPRLHGWWSTDPAVRFRMQPEVDEQPTADAWSLSNPPILALAPVLLSLEMFDRVGLPALRERSVRLTAYLEGLLDRLDPGRAQVITPRDRARRGAQLSLRCLGIPADDLEKRLRHEHGVIADARQPDVIRLAPVPMYSTYHDCWRAYDALEAVLGES
jgi:kynureninase